MAGLGGTAGQIDTVAIDVRRTVSLNVCMSFLIIYSPPEEVNTMTSFKGEYVASELRNAI